MLFHNLISLLACCVAVLECKTTKENQSQTVRPFPEGFLFGAASASYQVKGGWDADGKGLNMWDNLIHNEPCFIKDCSNGDVAADSYNQYKRDVEMMRELGLDYYRFSISWSRILPQSFPDKINEAGINYYNNLINEMLKYNIEPMVTLYHWDLPLKLQELGGWTNPNIVDWFGDYARIVFENFGDRVKVWGTVNEPREICLLGYGNVVMAPRLNIKGFAEYMCAKNLLMAHARAYHIYNNEFRTTQNGIIGITISADNTEPADDSEENIAASKDAALFWWGIYAHPVFSVTGDFPPTLKERIATKSLEQGFVRSRLPEFSPEEVEYVRGSSDYFGLNHYSTSYIYRNESLEGKFESPSYDEDLNVGFYSDNEWENTAFDWIKNNTLSSTLSAMLDAVEEGSDVRRYTSWSMMDTFEWINGYTERFGLYEVDYSDPSRPRTPRKSAFVYKQTVCSRALDLLVNKSGGNDCINLKLEFLTKKEIFEIKVDSTIKQQFYIERFGLYEVDYSDPFRPRTPRKSAFVYKQIVRSRALDWSYEPDTTAMTIDEGH